MDSLDKFLDPANWQAAWENVAENLRPTDFTYPTAEGGIYLADSARRVFLKHFENRISGTIAHPDASEPVSYRRIIQLQIQRYKRSVLDNTPYEPFRRST
jgi:CRISP-associated protein Cas1